MNMETAMKASVTGWKQQVTADHGKGRAAGKANFADTFSEMLKTGKKPQRTELSHRAHGRRLRFRLVRKPMTPVMIR